MSTNYVTGLTSRITVPRSHLAVARLAIQSLYHEIALYPKPGLVSFVDNGSHKDMTAKTFLRSLFALRTYFGVITAAGGDGASFDVLKQLGLAAEYRMLKATNGINTHRGAIFSLGLLCASVGQCYAINIVPTATKVRRVFLDVWGEDVCRHMNRGAGLSHGQLVANAHLVGGAREEAARGFPSVFNVGLPVLRKTLQAGGDLEWALVDVLFTLMAEMDDTNIYYRGGASANRFVRQRASAFLKEGGTANPDWRTVAVKCHHDFVRNNISPGGAADLLAATYFMHKVEESTEPVGSSALKYQPFIG
ncbi:triphosphoribosyl-dephospho-CoA synthase MdcB [Noviherbaspirillum saxi]|uniref:triphosphoribosyl-dephospho-CoA synthase MdcB n=1 Tax=Noviherbaspirillum saxi TaxID=2320863 RepID=UPI001314A4A8|nr:triphosphoribosyl-dephospho-CoA synthase MdcB [Noviherbaspirillum saxi]